MEAMEMERPMTEWNDDRLDELNGRVKDGFAQVDGRFIRLEGEMKEGFEKVDQRFIRLEGEMKEGFAKVDKRFEKVASCEEVVELRKDMNAGLNRISDRIDRLYHVVIVAVVGVIGTLFANGIWG
jgi:hypothetical protein